MSQGGQERHFTPLTEWTAAHTGLHVHRHCLLLAAWTLPTLGTAGWGRGGSGNECWVSRQGCRSVRSPKDGVDKEKSSLGVKESSRSLLRAASSIRAELSHVCLNACVCLTPYEPGPWQQWTVCSCPCRCCASAGTPGPSRHRASPIPVTGSQTQNSLKSLSKKPE